ncbi:MAG: hypothetical protein CK520_03945 [Actinobacteria bacterium]|nr:MAG: hypothetical protein CK520_03945 [Actinomycetota bacterium]
MTNSHPTFDHWTWRAEAISTVSPIRAAVIDIDGVLSEAASRQHYLENETQDWSGFFDACGEDLVIDEVRVLLDLLDPTLRIVLLTARPLRVHPLTEAWLARYSIRWDLLVMRPTDSSQDARDFKQSATKDLRSSGFDLVIAIEDDLRNVEMFRREGIPCLYKHSGYYE